MQKYLTLIFALLLSASIFAQHEPIQPFEELGIKVKVLTLSNGKYQESFPNDTIFRFGSVMFNRVTGEVVTVIENDTLYGEYNLKAEVVSRWLSPDPLEAKNSNWSPYTAINDNPILFVDPDGKDAIISITPGLDGKNGTILVLTIFHVPKGGLTDAVKAKAITSFKHTWGNGDESNTDKGSYIGKAFTGIDIEGQKYDVTYNIVFKESDNPSADAKEGQNTLSIIPDSDKSRTSNYGSGWLEYRAGQDQGTTFGHEMAHILGIGENPKMIDEHGTPSISSYEDRRDVITKDVVNSVKGAVQLAQGNGRSVVTLVTERMPSNMNTLNLKNAQKQTIRSSQYQAIVEKE